ncbi:MAG: repair protein RecO [Bacteroidetes bacterium]|nr:repair protein RecO [Bacteroidota bacterium]
MIVKSDSIVLKTMKYRESSMIATLLTRDYGKISVIAKGVRNKPRGGGTSLEPMNCVRAVIYRKPGRELQLLSQCDQVRAFKGLSEDLKRMAAGMAVVELANLAVAPDEAHPEVYELVAGTLGALSNATRVPENALYYFEVRLLGVLGFRPELRRCVQCEGSIEEFNGRNKGGPFRIGMHGVLCSACADQGHGEMDISLPALKALSALQDSPEAEAAFRIVLTPEMRGSIETILRRLVMHHLTGMKPLQSEHVFSMLT